MAMSTPAQVKALFETGDVLLAASFVALIDSCHPDAATLGTFTGSTIADNATVKAAIQSLETALESGGGGVTDHGALTGLSDDDHAQYLLADGSRAISAPITGATPTTSGHLATKGYVDGLAADFQYEIKTDDFTATPGKIYLVSLAANDVIATVPTTAGACSLVVVEAGTSATGYGSYDTETKMLLHCDALNANETPDEIGSARFIAYSSLSTAIKKFGTGSIVMSPGADLDIDDGATIAASGDWTYEGWFYWVSSLETDSVVLEVRDGGGIKEFAVDVQSGSLSLSDNSTILDTGSAPAADTWHHIAIVRDGTAGTLAVYLNGVLDMTATVASVTGTTIFTAQPALLTNDLHIDELRWRSDKVYTANFTPPTAAFGFDTPAPTAQNKLTIAGTDLEFLAAGDRIDFQADGTETVYQVIDDTVAAADLATVATTGSYDDLTDKPTIPTATKVYIQVALSPNGGAISAGAAKGFVPVHTAGTITAFRVDCDPNNEPSAASVQVDLNTVDRSTGTATSVLSAVASIATSTNSATGTISGTPSVAVGDLLQIDIDQGSDGQDLIATIEITPS